MLIGRGRRASSAPRCWAFNWAPPMAPRAGGSLHQMAARVRRRRQAPAPTTRTRLQARRAPGSSPAAGTAPQCPGRSCLQMRCSASKGGAWKSKLRPCSDAAGWVAQAASLLLLSCLIGGAGRPIRRTVLRPLEPVDDQQLLGIRVVGLGRLGSRYGCGAAGDLSDGAGQRDEEHCEPRPHGIMAWPSSPGAAW